MTYDDDDEESSEDADFNFESNIGSRRYPVHDCCEFEDADNLRRLIFVRQDDSDSSSRVTGSSTAEQTSSSSSSDDDDDDVGNQCPSTGIDGCPRSNPSRNEAKCSSTPDALNKINDGAASLIDTVKKKDEELPEDGRDPLELHEEVDEPETTKSIDKNPKHSDDAVRSENTVKSGKGAPMQQGEMHDLLTAKSDTIENTKYLPKNDNNVVPSANQSNEKKTDSLSCENPRIAKDDSKNREAELDKDAVSKEKSKENKREEKNPDEGISSSSKGNNKKDTISPTHKKVITGKSTLASTVKINQRNQELIKKPETLRKERKQKPEVVLYYCPYNIDERDGDENTPLHIAIHSCKLECVQLLLKAGASAHKKCDGSAPVHVAISIGALQKHADFSEQCVSLLAKHGADLSVKDEALHTPLYIACMSNLPRCVSIILSDPAGISTLNVRADRVGGRALHACAKFDMPPRGSRRARHHIHHHQGGMHLNGAGDAVLTRILLAMSGVEIDPVTNYGRTPLHIACSCGNWGVARLLLQAGANPHALDRRRCTPEKLAAKRGLVIPSDLMPHLGRGAGMSALGDANVSRDLIMDPDLGTLILCHDLCSKHRSCPPISRVGTSSDPPPENVRRLHVLLNEDAGILKSGEFLGCTWQKEARRAAMADVLKVHEYSYIEKISQLCLTIPDHPSAVASLDPDTAVSRWSFEAAMRAAGSVCEAVDKIMLGDHRNAFCAIRPPGHHAGPRGIVTCRNDPEGSHGFCLLNNVAIGAAYARSVYRNDGIRKVAIVDFDVHHGNGTEEIIRNLVPRVETSTVRTPFAIGTLQTSKYRPWLSEDDLQDVFFASTHGFGPRDVRFVDNMQPHQGGWFYPASGKSVTTDAVKNPPSIENIDTSEFLSTQTWARMGEDALLNCCKIIDVGLMLPRHTDVPGMQRVELRDAYRKNILPHLMAFNPDMIFVSAGFDAHKRDSMNFGYVGMIEDDYEWITDQLVKVANSCCSGRIVSTLEGGYKIHGGIVSPFARSVASHVRALVEGGCSRELYNESDGIWESKFERQMVEEKERRRQMKLDKLREAEIERRRSRQAGANSACFSASPAPVNNVHRDSEVTRKTSNKIQSHQEIPNFQDQPARQMDENHSSNLESALLNAQTLSTPRREEDYENDESVDEATRKRKRSLVSMMEMYEKMKN